MAVRAARGNDYVEPPAARAAYEARTPWSILGSISGPIPGGLAMPARVIRAIFLGSFSKVVA
eukprot:CAMPEP_0174727432 /NCGR_PEP_ID=MMETSP1094-20130205/49772_1 /TAXON_ID=156173 /ORGANISM="Chrysochromulina brevifilum, Strain UTEX LB 985" /LENGTH=61 /DNA_ID=CAMNT_0015929171 /DNA_START=158 /DNA_END=339 /DNA_ORIENTATION=-